MLSQQRIVIISTVSNFYCDNTCNVYKWKKSGKSLHRISPVRPFTMNSECLAVYIVVVDVNASAHHCMPFKSI